MQLDPIFTDNVVFAEGKPIAVYGTGRGDVHVELCGVSARTQCGADGKWRVTLPAMPAGGPYSLKVASGGEEKVLKNVYIGTVLLVIGQSNAEFQLRESNTPESEYASDPLLRDFVVDCPWTPDAPIKTSDGWLEADKDRVGCWSAIGYLTGKYLRAATGKAVGIISCFKGATVIESWLPREVAEEFRLPDEQLYYDHYCADFAMFNGNGQIYETMLSRVLPFPVSAAVWYQGESDTTQPEADIYPRELKTLISVIRSAQNDPRLLFAAVQIADFDWRRDNDPDGWRAIQRAQEEVAANDGRVALVVSKDVCESAFIHPPTKTLLSERIARAIVENL